MSLTTASSNGTPNPAFKLSNMNQDHSNQTGQDLPGKDESKGKKKLRAPNKT